MGGTLYRRTSLLNQVPFERCVLRSIIVFAIRPTCDFNQHDDEQSVIRRVPSKTEIEGHDRFFSAFFFFFGLFLNGGASAP